MSGCRGVSLQPLPSQSSLSCFQTHGQQWGGGGNRAIRRPRGWGWGSQVEADGQDTSEVLKGRWARPLSVFSKSVDALAPGQAQGQG